MNKTSSPLKITLQQWKFFVSAVEKGSFLKVAVEFDTDVAQVSREIQKLEHALSEPLLERSHSGVRPTWVGRQKYAEAKAIIEDFCLLIKKGSPEEQCFFTIKIAVPESFADLLMKPLADFEKGSRSSPLKLELTSFDNIFSINPENFDLIFCVENLPNVRFIAYEVAEIDYGVFASSFFLNNHFLPKEPEDLGRLPLICQKKATILFQGPHESVGVQIEPQIKVNSVSSMLRSALEGLGVAVGVPLWRIVDLDKTQDLIRLLPDWELPKSKVWLLKHPGKAGAPLEKLVLFIKNAFSKERKVNHQAPKAPSVTYHDHP